MFATVQLLNGFAKLLTYKIPDNFITRVHPGVLVRVPLRNRYLPALVCATMAQLSEKKTFRVKEIKDFEQIPQDEKYHRFIEKIAQFYFVKPIHFYARITSFLHDERREDVVLGGCRSRGCQLDVSTVVLTAEQQAVVDYVSPFIEASQCTVTVVHGVTGSGKTEVYKKLIQQCIQQGRVAMMIVPEVALSMQFERLLKQQLPDIEIFGFHSATNVSEKKILWQALIEQRAILVLGVHLPVMLPIANLGLLIVDEEHEQGFVEKRHPRLNSKELALWRASIYNIPVVLGSATPSLTSLHNVATGKWKLFHITQRFSGAFPTIQKVLLSNKEGKRRKNFWVSCELEDAIQRCLSKKEQIIIYLNRRGYSFFVQCKQCGFIFECPHCSVSLTLHIQGQEALRCHYCDFVRPLPAVCPGCSADQKNFLKKGIGTQQAVQIFKELFPQAKIARADLDTTSKKKLWQDTVQQFERGELDMLVGTQTITKGYHFPGVTLIGILWADVNLHFPLYNASETTLQQIIQVAGRAGRCHSESRVIVQTLRDHSIFKYIDEQYYLDFCKEEIDVRRECIYPPHCRLIHFELRHKECDQVDKDAAWCADFLQKICHEQQLPVMILGPAMPLISKIQKLEIRQIFLKSRNFGDLHHIIHIIEKQKMISELLFVFH